MTWRWESKNQGRYRFYTVINDRKQTKQLGNGVPKGDRDYSFWIWPSFAFSMRCCKYREMMFEAAAADFKQTQWIYFEDEILKPHAPLKHTALGQQSVILCWIRLHTAHHTNLPNSSSPASVRTTITNRKTRQWNTHAQRDKITHISKKKKKKNHAHTLTHKQHIQWLW